MIARFSLVCLLLPLAATAEGFEEHLLLTPHPGRAEAVFWTRQAGEAYRDQKPEIAEQALEQALMHDPLLPAAWINLCAVRVHSEKGHRALFACQMALWLVPDSKDLATNTRLAARLSRRQPEPLAQPPDETIESLEYGLTRDASNARGWLRLAARMRAEGRKALALVFEERALEAGAERSALVCRVVRDLQDFGLLRRALEVLESEQRRGTNIAGCRTGATVLRERIDALRNRASLPAETVAEEAGLRQAQEVDGVVRLAEILLTRAANDDDMDVLSRLRKILGVGERSVERGVWGRIAFPPGWVRLAAQEDEGWPLLVMRRFPGDTQVLVFDWANARKPLDETPERTIARLLSARDPVLVGSWSGCDDMPSDVDCRQGTIDLDMGVEGRAATRWRLIGPKGSSRRSDAPDFTFAVATMIGDAGCGDLCHERVTEEVESTLAEAHWRTALAESSRKSSRRVDSWRWPVPSAWQARREHEEKNDPWRTFILEGGIAIDLPPGVVAALPTAGYSDENCDADTRLWFRGRWIGRDSEPLTLGDAKWAATLSVRPGEAHRALAPEGLARWTIPRDAEAAQTHRVDLGAALATLPGAKRGVVARFGGGDFSGTWLSVRLDLSGDLIEISLPILENPDSSSWLWIPMTVRSTDSPPPPVLVDLSGKFSVAFKSNEDRDDPADPREGRLTAGEVSLDVPKGFRVSLNPDSRDGFPIRMRDDQGTILKLERHRGRKGVSVDDVRQRVEKWLGRTPSHPWRKNGRGRRGTVWSARFAATESFDEELVFLLVARNPDLRASYTLRLSGGLTADALWSKSMIRVLGGSFRFRKVK